MQLVLASTSSFKSNVLKQACIKHIKKDSNYIEVKQDNEDVYEYVKRLSLEKARSVDISDSIVLGLDTVVVIGNKILEKPESIHEAKDNLRLCSNNTFKLLKEVLFWHLSSKGSHPYSSSNCNAIYFSLSRI